MGVIWDYKGCDQRKRACKCKCVVNMNKKQKQMLMSVLLSNKQALRDVYKTCSQDKHIAFNACRLDCADKHGFCLRITSANTFSFSCGFLYYDNDKHLRCRYYTAYNTYDFIAE